MRRKKSRNHPSITSFEDAKHLMLEKFGKNYTYHCFFDRKEPSRDILEFWNGFLCALEITGIITPDDAKKILFEISGNN